MLNLIKAAAVFPQVVAAWRRRRHYDVAVQSSRQDLLQLGSEGRIPPADRWNCDDGTKTPLKLLFDVSPLQANDAGDYFPIWGTCQGFQQLSVLTARKNLLTQTRTKAVALPLTLTPGVTVSSSFTAGTLRRSRVYKKKNNPLLFWTAKILCFQCDVCTRGFFWRLLLSLSAAAAQSSRLFRSFPKDLLRSLADENVTANFHSWSLSVQVDKFYCFSVVRNCDSWKASKCWSSLKTLIGF